MFKSSIFVPFVTLGDPTKEQSAKLIKSLIDNGAGALELGFAFSDPIADGPVIQRANNRALKSGITTKKAFEILEDAREYSSIPISLMLSFNIMFSYGTEKFYKKCSETGIDAVLVPDVPLEESKELVELAKKYAVHHISLITPTTTDERMRAISKISSGYAYLVSLLGTTGTREKLAQELPEMISRAKKNMPMPVYVGFGVSKPGHVQNVLGLGADGAISGSAVCKIIEKNLENFGEMEKEIGKFCREMSGRADKQNLKKHERG